MTRRRITIMVLISLVAATLLATVYSVGGVRAQGYGSCTATVSPSSGSQGTTVVLSVTGDPDSHLNIYWDWDAAAYGRSKESGMAEVWGQDVGTIVTDASGNGSTSFTVPSGAASGSHVIGLGTPSAGGSQCQATFTVVSGALPATGAQIATSLALCLAALVCGATWAVKSHRKTGTDSR